MEESNPPANYLLDAAREAGRIGMRYFRQQDTKVWYKSGNSPVTEADKEIDDFLRNTLTSEKPDYAWLSEETADDLKRLDAERVFIVDPIDGTRGFVAGQPEWCISIAVVENGIPIEGILYCPALDRLLHARRGYGLRDSSNAQMSADASRPVQVTGSRKLIEWMETISDRDFEISEFIPSLAYRLAKVAVGELDGAFAYGGANEWDVAAADIILSESGCKLMEHSGERLTYNKEKSSFRALIATSEKREEEILALANSHGILQ